MKENLNKSILLLIALETLIWIVLSFFDDHNTFGLSMLFTTIIINIVATILLFIYKPKFYLLTALVLLSFFLLPIFALVLYISSAGC